MPKTVLEYGVGNLETSSGALMSTANYLKAHGWQRGAGYQPGEPIFAAIEAWNAATVYQQAIAIIGGKSTAETSELRLAVFRRSRRPWVPFSLGLTQKTGVRFLARRAGGRRASSCGICRPRPVAIGRKGKNGLQFADLRLSVPAADGIFLLPRAEAGAQCGPARGEHCFLCLGRAAFRFRHPRLGRGQLAVRAFPRTFPGLGDGASADGRRGRRRSRPARLLQIFRFFRRPVQRSDSASRLAGGEFQRPAPAAWHFVLHLHALSYVIDIYRRDAKAQEIPVDFALYLAFFPQLIAGPIVRYHDISEQLSGARKSSTSRCPARSGRSPDLARKSCSLTRSVRSPTGFFPCRETSWGRASPARPRGLRLADLSRLFRLF